MVRWPVSDSKTPLNLMFQVPMKPKRVVPEAKIPAPTKEVAAPVRGTSLCLCSSSPSLPLEFMLSSVSKVILWLTESLSFVTLCS